MNLQNQIRYLNDVLKIDMFDECTVPAGLDMARVRGAIVMRCGLLTPLFSEPETQRNATQQFFIENQWNFQHIVNIINAEYSPIENVFEDSTETENQKGTDAYTLGITKAGSATTTNTISAENATTYQPDRETTENDNSSDSHVKSGNDSRDITRTKNRHGNVGVTTNQSMITEEISLIERFNPYKFIADLYEKELILGLY